MQIIDTELRHTGRRYTDKLGSTITETAQIAIMTIERLQRMGIGILLLSVNAEGKTAIHITEPPSTAAQLLSIADCQHGLCIAHLGGAEIRWFQDPQPSSTKIEETA